MKRQSGVALALVLVLVLVLSASIYTFSGRAVVDAVIVRNRDAAAQAEALARGGVQLATALLLEDLIPRETEEDGASAEFDTLNDLWARVGQNELIAPDGGILRIRIRDTGALLNLNGLIDFRDPDAAPDPDAEEFLVAFLSKVIDEIPLPPGEKLYDPRELARNLIDYLDPDEVRISGGAEDEAYLRQDPPYQAANRPLLSVEELRRVEGFDADLVAALRPYVTVYPLAGSGGINLNTAPPHVLAAIYHGPQGDRRLASEDQVREVLRVREAGGIICDQTEKDPERCVLPSEVGMAEGSIYPPAALPAQASVFTVVSEARVGEIVRSVEAVIDRSLPTEPRLLSWRLR